MRKALPLFKTKGALLSAKAEGAKYHVKGGCRSRQPPLHIKSFLLSVAFFPSADSSRAEHQTAADSAGAALYADMCPPLLLFRRSRVKIPADKALTEPSSAYKGFSESARPVKGCKALRCEYLPELPPEQ